MKFFGKTKSNALKPLENAKTHLKSTNSKEIKSIEIEKWVKTDFN